MAKTYQAKADRGQFCETIFPEPLTRLWRGPAVHLQHRLICCDCGLSHDMEFVVVRTRRKGGKTQMVALAPSGFAIQFRARRNERSTAQVRRKRQKRK